MEDNREKQDAHRSSATIPIVEEQVKIDKQLVDTGTVYVRKEVDEKQVNIAAMLSQDDVEVDRVPINQPVTVAPPAVRYEGNTMIVSVLQEELVIQKRLVLVEEIRISKEKKSKEITHPVKIRREKVFIEHSDERMKEGKD